MTNGWIGFLLAGILWMTAQQALTIEAPIPDPPQDQTAAESLEASPVVKQGEVLTVRLHTPGPDLERGATAWLTGLKVPLFRQADGSLEGLVPVAVNQKPGTYRLSVRDGTSRIISEKSIQVTDARYARQNIGVTKKMGGLQPEPGELEAVGRLKTDTDPASRSWTLPFVLPTDDCMSSPFGNLRYHNGVFSGDYHKGIDFRSPRGRPVRAANAGKVKIARFYRLHGGTVGIDHGQGVSTIYIHLSKILVKPGATINKGQPIGEVGDTGFATGPNLHYGLFVNGLPVNPLQWLKPRRCS